MPEYTTDPERLTKLETELESMKMVLLRMEAKMDSWQTNFVSKEILDDKLKLRDERIERLEQEKNTNKNTAPLWVGAIFTGISLFIMIYGLLIK